jgi:glyoxylase-like metal-dependent hydrolase (beta-lactamase superfamily II)
MGEGDDHDTAHDPIFEPAASGSKDRKETDPAMNEIVPGIVHWKKQHPNIGAEVSSYYLVGERVLIDPMEPEEGMDWFREHGEPVHVLLSNRHHYRDSSRFVEAFGCSVHASRPGMHEFTSGEPVEPFDFGDELPGGVTAHEAGAICPDDSVLHIPSVSALSVADGVINYGGLGFVPDEHLGDDPDATKRSIRESYARLLELDFDNLLVAHGEPVLGGAKDALRGFAEG